jgi:hypothetical protein
MRFERGFSVAHTQAQARGMAVPAQERMRGERLHQARGAGDASCDGPHGPDRAVARGRVSPMSWPRREAADGAKREQRHPEPHGEHERRGLGQEAHVAAGQAKQLAKGVHPDVDELRIGGATLYEMALRLALT